MTRKEKQQQTIEKKKKHEQLKKHREKRYGGMDAWMDVVFSTLYGQQIAN